MVITLCFVSLSLTLAIDYFIASRYYSPVLAIVWLASIIFYIGACTGKKLGRTWTEFSRITIPACMLSGLILLPVLVRVLCLYPDRIHGDSTLTAYLSVTEKFSGLNFFSGIPSDKSQWQSQFPSPYFILQKLLLKLFGETITGIQLSVMPYVFVESVMLYLTVKRLFGKKVGAISVYLFSFLAISIYFDTFGLLFTSSNAVFSVLFYSGIAYLQSENRLYSSWMGIFCGFCYLFYLTSYIALPVMLIFFIFQYLKTTNVSVLKDFVTALAGFFIVLSPFLTQAFRFDNYFTSRTSQVSLITGTMSGEKEKIAKGENPLRILENSTLQFGRAFYSPDIAGAGGFDFAHQAFFDKFTFWLAVLGLFMGILMVFAKVELIVLFSVILLSSTTVVFAILPPSFHRFILSFPFICILIALPFRLLWSGKYLPRSVKMITTIFFLSFYSVSNISYFREAIKRETVNPDLDLSAYINRYFPGRNLYIAAYPGFGFEKTYYFAPGKNALRVITGYHSDLLAKFPIQEKYVYVILFPYDFNDKFREADPAGTIIPVSNQYSLFVN